MKKRKTLILMLSLVCLLVVGIGFAAIAGITLKASGTVNLTPNNDAFQVVFSEGTKTAGGTDADTVSVTGATATINVTSLQSKGASVTFTLTIKNSSTDDIDATVAKPSVTSETDTANAFTVTTQASWTGDTTVLAPNATTTITVTVTLDIAPIDTISGSFVVDCVATPTLAA